MKTLVAGRFELTLGKVFFLKNPPKLSKFTGPRRRQMREAARETERRSMKEKVGG